MDKLLFPLGKIALSNPLTFAACHLEDGVTLRTNANPVIVEYSVPLDKLYTIRNPLDLAPYFSVYKNTLSPELRRAFLPPGHPTVPVMLLTQIIDQDGTPHATTALVPMPGDHQPECMRAYVRLPDSEREVVMAKWRQGELRSDRCAHCGELGFQLPKCSRCAESSSPPRYCGKECQRAHWPTHKGGCGK